MAKPIERITIPIVALETLFRHLEGHSMSSDIEPRRGMERGFRREKVLFIVLTG